jgi:hypothetical protein
MSAKILNSRYAEEIDMMIKAGKSSRSISEWLSIHGEKISHVTISHYRLSLTSSEEDESTDTNPTDFEESLLSKVERSIDNPVKLKHYLDSYLKLKSINETTRLTAKTPIEQETLHLPPAEQREVFIEKLIKMAMIMHPSRWSSDTAKKEVLKTAPEKIVEWKNWKKEAPLLLRRIFDGGLS